MPHKTSPLPIRFWNKVARPGAGEVYAGKDYDKYNSSYLNKACARLYGAHLAGQAEEERRVIEMLRTKTSMGFELDAGMRDQEIAR